MSDDYTPTTDQILEAWVDRFDSFSGPRSPEEAERSMAEFERWFAAHDAEVRADEREKCKTEVNEILERDLVEYKMAREFCDPIAAGLSISNRTLGRLDLWATQDATPRGDGEQ